MLDAAPDVARKIRTLGAFFLLIGCLLNPWFLVQFRETEEIGTGLALFILLADLFLIAIGISFLLSKRKRAVFRTVVGAACAMLWIGVALTCAELYLLPKSPVGKNPYDPFSVQHLHPFYFFSLPSDPRELARINNAVVFVTSEGFRGPGPERKGNRKLAFVLGGSAAFGSDATNDQTTISGYLNQMQHEFHFVNAGVPSWNSTQEFYRVAMQLLHYKPELIVVFNGFNDATLNRRYRRIGTPAPPGTPESYDDLVRWVDDIRSSPLVRFNLEHFHVLTFPRTRTILGEALGGMGTIRRTPRTERRDSSTPISVESVNSDAASYLWNIGNMGRLAAARETRLVVFWQPTPLLHRITPPDRGKFSGEESEFLEYLQRFHRYVMEHRTGHPQVHDFGDLFDRHAEEVRLADLFTDDVHLTDRGNHIVASEIWSRISKSSTR